MAKSKIELPFPTAERLARRNGGYVPNEFIDAERVEMTNDEYHSTHSRGTISRSELATFAANPNEYRTGVLLRSPDRKITDSMRFGQCLHMLLLKGNPEPPFVPDCARAGSPLAALNRRQGKAWERWVDENGPYYVLPGEADKMSQMIERVRTNDAVKEFLDLGGRFNVKHESTIFATHRPTGIRTRCRFDIESVWLFDLKKTADASPSAFASSCVDFGYHCQGAFYQDHHAALNALKDPAPFLLIAVQDSGDFRCEVYEMAPEFIQIGRELNAMRLDLFAMFAAAWKIIEERFESAGAGRPNPETLWSPVSEGVVQYLLPPSKAMYQKEWETDLKTAHEQLTKRVEKVCSKLPGGAK